MQRRASVVVFRVHINPTFNQQTRRFVTRKPVNTNILAITVEKQTEVDSLASVTGVKIVYWRIRVHREMQKARSVSCP